MSSRIPVAVVGATGLAGQQFLASLAGHPMFEIRKLAASSRSAGKKLADAVKDDKGASKWFCSEPLSAEHAGITVEDSAHMTNDGIRLVFCPSAPPTSRSSRRPAPSATSPTCRCFSPA
jgi:aspartate-semialdehyde dehydrogenase